MKIKNFFKAIDETKKIFFSNLFTVLITSVFAIYNFYLGFKYGDSWGISIFVYFLCMIIARITVIFIEKKVRKKDTNEQLKIKRKTFLILSLFMFFMDFCLFAPISLMIIYPKKFTYGLIPAILVAAFTTYKLIYALVNYGKLKKTNNILFEYLGELSVVDSLVSLLMLQHILIMVNSGMTHNMMILSAVSSLIILIIIIIFTLYETVKILKVKINNY